MGTWGIGHWNVVLIIVLLVFGTKRLTSGAKDIGKAVNEFKKGMREDDDKPAQLSDQTKRETSSESQRNDDNVAR